MNAIVRTIEVHLEVPFAISRSVRTSRKIVLVELAEGVRTARGEATADPYFGETPETVEGEVRAALDLLGDDPPDLDGACARIDARFPHGGAASCALDVLAHDRAAQTAGVTLREFVGLGEGEAPPTSYTIGLAEPGVMAERAAAAAAKGYKVLKVKLARRDCAVILSAIRERYAGPIRVDPNGAWTADEAPAHIAGIVPFGIEFVEQPVDPRDVAALRRVRERSELPIVADEAAVRSADLRELATACDGVNVKLQKCGGIAEARRMIALAHELGLRVMLGCRAAETSVGIAAAAHLAPAVEWADLDGNLLIVDDPFAAVPVEDGRFAFSDRPGLGVVPRAAR
ncbi:MAG: dipeptide epimerase [Chloroflexota bacterium]|nr:dipeptide epimerase [Chloroflexota bacterium]